MSQKVSLFQVLKFLDIQLLVPDGTFILLFNPGKIKFNYLECLDGSTFICFARTVSKRIGDYRSPETFFSIGMGFDVKYAERCIYSEGIDFQKPVPTGFILQNLRKRKIVDKEHFQIHRTIKFDENVRGFLVI